MKSGLNLVQLATEIERRANAKVDLVAKTEALVFTATGDEKNATFGTGEGIFEMNRLLLSLHPRLGYVQFLYLAHHCPADFRDIVALRCETMMCSLY